MRNDTVTMVKIDETLCKRIEAIQFEVNARKDLLAFMMDGRLTIDSEQFEKYHDEYIQYHVEYEKAKQELQDKYVPDGSKRWELDFSSCEVKIYA